MNKENLEKIFNDDLGSSYFPQLAEEYIKEGDYKLAKKVCNVGLLLNPSNNDGKFILAKIEMISGSGKVAEGLLKEILSEDRQKIIENQQLSDELKLEEEQEKKEKFLEQQELKNKSSQAPASMSLPKLDNTMMAGMTAGSAANIDPTTNLTTTETALLSPLEQAYYTNKRRV